MSLTSKLKAASAAFALVAGAATSAQGAIVTLDKEGATVWGSPVLARNVTYTIDGTSRYHGAGMFRLQDVSTSELILAFCIDIFQVLKLPHTYDTTSFLDGGVLGQVESLYANFYGDIATADQAAGFQIALWEITTEKSSSLDLSTGRFIITGTGAHYDVAADYLNGLGTPSTNQYDITTFFSNTSQDLVTGKYVSVAAVPVPAGLLTLSTGLMGLYGMRRRKKA